MTTNVQQTEPQGREDEDGTFPSVILPEPIDVVLVEDAGLQGLTPVTGQLAYAAKFRSPSTLSVAEDPLLNEAPSPCTRYDVFLSRAAQNENCTFLSPEAVSIKTASSLCFGDEADALEDAADSGTGLRMRVDVEGEGTGKVIEASKKTEDSWDRGKDRSEHNGEEEGTGASTVSKKKRDTAEYERGAEAIDARPQSVWRAGDRGQEEEKKQAAPLLRGPATRYERDLSLLRGSFEDSGNELRWMEIVGTLEKYCLLD